MAIIEIDKTCFISHYVVVDDDDLCELLKYNWTSSFDGYCWRVYRSAKIEGEHGHRCKRKIIFMHRQIMNAQPGQEIDHINHDGLDNRKRNLRFCTHAQNMQNRRKVPNTSSKYKGVTWDKKKGKWMAIIMKEGRNNFLGYFTSEVAAARAYDKKALELFEEFSCLNFKENLICR